ncbi:MAG TPA: hypothetical protein VJ724_00090 [Tahibacter sp.]|nr:hypothetical protein [Tahibacter sp.]
MALSLAPLAALNAATLNFNEERVDFPTMQVLPYSGGTVTSMNVLTPMLCALVTTNPPEFGANSYFNPAFGNLVFGPLSAQNTATPVAGVGSWSYTSNGLSVTSDPNLVCYGTNGSGVMRSSQGVFEDDFETLGFDAQIATRVIQLPTIDNGYVYKYYVDVNVPAMPATTVVSVREGYDKTLFDSATSYYCQASNATSCGTPARYENVAFTLPIPAGVELGIRYIVSRPLRPGVTSLPVTSVPVTIAALYLPPGMEKRLDNNVSASYGQLTDARPEIVTTGAAAALVSMTEGQSLTDVTFSLDDDTTETAGSLLGATATLTFNNTPFPVTADCGSATPITANPRVTRTCTVDVVTPAIDYATDASPGVYAPNVSAKLTIVATDARGQTTTVDLPIHVASADNDKPVFTVSSIAAPPAGGPDKTPTVTCSLASKGSPQCVGTYSDFLLDIAPGPEGATDELAAQTVALVPDTSTGRNGNIACALDSGSSQIFALSGGPRVTLAGDGKSGNVVYGLNGIEGAATCSVKLTDGGTLYPGQSAVTETKTFRIVVTP